MLISDKEYLELFESATSNEKKYLINHMGIEEAEILHDAGYQVYFNNGEAVRVVSKDGNTTWYATGHNNN